MSANAILQICLYLALLLVLALPLARYMARVLDGRLRFLSAVERTIYRLVGVDALAGMSWKTYVLALLVFNLLGALAVYGLQIVQDSLPLNPQSFPAVSADSAFNTAVSFVSNTNWQGYGGETTMSYLTQMLALAVQNFLSAATGIAVAFVLMRAFAARESASLGNFWVDVTRITLYVLLPLSLLLALLLVNEGVIQNFAAYLDITTLEGGKQTLAMGPVASQEAIKMLGTNGGGFFNANSAHPFENPTALSNLLEMLAIFVIPAALCLVFGEVVAQRRQGWAVLASMTLLFVMFLVPAVVSEQQGNPALARLGVDQTLNAQQPGGNMEGKESRFGIVNSALFATITTAAFCGAVNSMHDSYTPLGGMVPMVLMQLGEVVFGGVGSGFYGMLMFALLAVFVAGLMIGRTPEYIGKKIGAHEMKLVSVAILTTPFLVLVGTAIAAVSADGLKGLANPGAHGLSEMLYAFSSAANNNGSAFAGLSANTPFYNILLGLAMWFGSFLPIIAIVALAGSLAKKKIIPESAGSLPTHGPLFALLLAGTVLMVGALTFVPALALGPIVEHLLLAGN